MGSQRNPNSGNLKDILKRIYKLEHAAPMNNAAIGRDGLLVYDGGVITIENGGLDVTGTATISGTLNVSGSTTLSGVTTIAGPTGITGALTIQGLTDVTGELTVTGPTTLDGETTISGNTTVTGDLAVDGPLDVTGDTTLGGTTEITGITTLRSELIVEQGKKITLGGLVLENQSAGSAAMQMPGGGILSDTTLGMSIANSTRVKISGGEALLEGGSLAGMFSGASRIEVYPTNIKFKNLATASAGYTANLYIAADGRIWRTAA